MTSRSARWLARALAGLYLGLAGAGLILQLITRTSFARVGVGAQMIFYAILGTWTVTGALIVSRHPRNPVGWILLGVSMAALDIFAYGYAAYDLYVYPGSLPGVPIAYFWLNWSGMPFGVLLLTLLLLLFPTGRLISTGWRWVARTAVGALASYLALKAVEPGPLVIFPFVDNPFAVAEPLWAVLGPLMWGAFGLLVLCYLAAGASLLLRLRRARGDERQQIKWLLYPPILFVLGIPLVVFGEFEPTGTLFLAGGATHMIAVTGMVIATAFAIFKYRLYDVDLIINRSLVYGALTGTLALVYFSSVALLQQIFPAESQISIVLSTLAIAGLFAPLRRRVQRVIDRRFYRRKYDAQQTLAAFSARMRAEVELERISETLLAVVEETMKPAQVSLWLKQAKGKG